MSSAVCFNLVMGKDLDREILDFSKFKYIADNKLNVPHLAESVSQRVEIFMGKGAKLMLVSSIFSLNKTFSIKFFLFRLLKLDYVVRVNPPKGF